MKEELKKLEFKAQLAHDGSVTRKIADFSNVKELYQRLAEAFSINRNEVSYDWSVFPILYTYRVFNPKIKNK